MVPSPEQQKAYWFRQLSEPPHCPNLPWDAEPPPVPSYVRETCSAEIQPPSWRIIRGLATRLRATPEAVLLAALEILLFRYTGQTDLILGTLVHPNASPARQWQLVPLRLSLAGHRHAQGLLIQVEASLREASEHLELPAGAWNGLIEFGSRLKDGGLFNVSLIFAESGSIPDSALCPAQSNALASCALVLRAREEDGGLKLDWDYDAERLTASTVKRISGHLACLLNAIAAEPRAPLERLGLLTAGELRQFAEWNATATNFPPAPCIHRQIEAQVASTPDAVAVVYRDRQLTYAELNARSNQVAARLSKLGVGPKVVVGLCVERSLDMLVGLLGILKAGGAYLPLDPAHPSARLAFQIDDAQPKVLLTQGRLAKLPPPGGRLLLRLDADWDSIASESAENLERKAALHDLAYVLYTSGSTGTPKGVMVEHHSLVNFFAGMDARIQHGPGSTWLAVTSPSFDISVLELFWTLARGFKIVLQADDPAGAWPPSRREVATGRPMEFSLFYFSSEQNEGPGGPYKLLAEGAKFADQHGFVAVWTPERHFHEFGGLYPNPAITGAALAMITQRVQIRAGSVVAPLHSPIRIAEEWAVVDNLSKGRVAISFASGWMPEDFALSPGNYSQRKEIMLQYIDTVRRLWRGERVPMPGPLDKDVPVGILPRPVQRELPSWLTAAGNPETFELAGRLGLNLLTHLLGQNLEEVSKKIALYRRAWSEAGHAGRGHVTLMLHTFVGQSMEAVKAAVRTPLIEYLRRSADLIKGYAWAFSAFKRTPQSGRAVDLTTLPKEEMDALLEHAFERYFETSGLFGTPQSCLKMVEMLRANDIDETACLIDFGVAPDLVLTHLEHLDQLRRLAGNGSELAPADYSIPALMQRHRVTHFQCTPSMASLLLLDERMKLPFGQLHYLLIGGESFPLTLARQLRALVKGYLFNMYGPTETTVWSSVYAVPPEPARILVGRPIANTQMYVVDQNLIPVPVGIPGELLIGGAGVSRGYLARPELMAERFIQNTSIEDGPNRFYRTGDLARYLPDGNLELLGRADHQIKIRGHRVEPGEIETRLNEHPSVRESVVVAQETADGHKQLVAFVIPPEGQKPAPSQLRHFAGEKLPDYMVPARVVFLTAFPQTPNRKIDRQALAVMKAAETESERDFEPPVTAVEHALAGYWRELLSVPLIGRHDNFFERGGDSLLAMHLAAWVREQYEMDLPLRSLFEHPTLAGLAEVIQALAWSATATPGIETAGEREEVEI